MAIENPLQIVSREAGANVTNKRFVTEATGIVTRAATEGVKIDGVVAMVSTGFTSTAITAGDPAPVCKSGKVIVESGGDVAANAEVMTDNVGRAIEWDSEDPTKYAVGINRGAAVTGAGKDLSIELYARAQAAGVAPDES